MTGIVGVFFGWLFKALFEAFASRANDADRTRANKDAAINSASLDRKSRRGKHRPF
jgi:hypothetical protein